MPAFDEGQLTMDPNGHAAPGATERPQPNREEAGPVADAAALRCVGCGYDLAGLDPAAQCPECGLAIHESIAPRMVGRVTLSDARWLQGRMLSIALCQGLWALFLIAVVFAFSPVPSPGRSWLAVCWLVVAVAYSTRTWIGIWRRLPRVLPGQCSRAAARELIFSRWVSVGVWAYVAMQLGTGAFPETLAIVLAGCSMFYQSAAQSGFLEVCSDALERGRVRRRTVARASLPFVFITLLGTPIMCASAGAAVLVMIGAWWLIALVASLSLALDYSAGASYAERASSRTRPQS